MRVMRTVFYSAVLAAGLAGCSDQGLPLLSGESLQKTSEHWTLINYWATWCTPCREEIPELNRLDQEPYVRVVGVNFDQLKGEALSQAVAEMQIEFAVALDDPRQLWAYEVPQALPATIVITPSGEVTDILLGPQTVESLQQAMGSPP